MVEYLDPDIAGEGVSAAENWAPPIMEARIPDYKGLPSIRKYFPQFTGVPYQHKVFPCWLYHKSKPAVLVQDVINGDGRIVKKASDIAKEMGCIFRKSTPEEIGQGFPLNRWEFSGDWRPIPFHTKFDPANPGAGKILVKEKADQTSQTDLIAAVVAAVLAKAGQGSPDAPAIDPDRAEFEAFKAWKAMQGGGASSAPAVNALAASTPADPDKAEALKMADEMGVKVDRRLSADKILAELAKPSKT